jgi:hypothetical protein
VRPSPVRTLNADAVAAVEASGAVTLEEAIPRKASSRQLIFLKDRVCPSVVHLPADIRPRAAQDNHSMIKTQLLRNLVHRVQGYCKGRLSLKVSPMPLYHPIPDSKRHIRLDSSSTSPERTRWPKWSI